MARVSYATSLMKKGVLISTTEHLLSAFIGTGIDNAIVELDNLELPILDGSARPFVEMIHQAGIRKQRRLALTCSIRRELELREGDKFIAVYPADSYSVSYTINFPHPLIGRETFRVDLSDGNTYARLLPARTFGFPARSGSHAAAGPDPGCVEENAIVLTREAVMNPPLRFPDEFVRHKVLDLIGDLALVGKQILGSIVADRAGHAMHTALVSRSLCVIGLCGKKLLWRKMARRHHLPRPRWPYNPFNPQPLAHAFLDDRFGKLATFLVSGFAGRLRILVFQPPFFHQSLELGPGLLNHAGRKILSQDLALG